MSWRIIQVGSPCHLAVKNKQLLYEPIEPDKEKLTIPLEDISVIVLENKQISLHNSLISEIAEYNIVLFTCDFSHIPSGVFIPFHNHCRYSEIAFNQIEMSEPLKKRIWQKIIKTKIYNQSTLLKKINNSQGRFLEKISEQVQSGDAKNSESYAASIYWKNIFENFKRHDDDIKNKALNYGYAIIRGSIARSIVGAGLIPCFGLHHNNKLNAYNLVDDLIEPFRPFIDLTVLNMGLCEKDLNLTPSHKQILINTLTKNCSYKEEEITILKACELSAISLAKSIVSKDISNLILPYFSKLPLFEESCG